MTGMDQPEAKTGLGVLGVGAVACAACCAGPVLGFLAGVGLTAAVGLALFGIVGLVAVFVTAGVLWRGWRARRCAPAAASTGAEPVPVETPRLRVQS
jgi:hypothetical protein